MKLRRLHLAAYGPFTGKLLDFDRAGTNLFLVHGRNEAGKSATLRALCDLRYGIPMQSGDNFLHDYADMAIGGVFLDRQGRSHSLMRRKKRDGGLSFHDFDDPSPQAIRAVPPDIQALLTGGIGRDDFLTMYGLDHERLRIGGRNLLRGEGDVGAALFEASAGIRSIPALLDALDDEAKQHVSRGKNARINLALSRYAEHHEEHKRLLVRPSAWTDLNRRHEAAKAHLSGVRDELKARRERQLLVRELRAVAPLLAARRATETAWREVAEAPLLDKQASQRRIAAETTLSSALTAAASAAERMRRLQEGIAAISVDETCLRVEKAIARLDSAQESIGAAASELREALAAERRAEADLAAAAAAIDAAQPIDASIAQAPSATQRAEMLQVLDQFDGSGADLARLDAQLEELRPKLDAALQAPPPREACLALRAAMREATRVTSAVERLATLPRETAAAQRTLDAALRDVGLAPEALPLVHPLLDHDIDAAAREANDAAAKIDGWRARIAEVEAAIRTYGGEREELMSRGAVPTPDEVAAARDHRDTGWRLVRRSHVDGELAPTHEALMAYGQGRPLVAVYEQAIQTADRLVDELSRDATRAARLQQLQHQIADLNRDAQHLATQIETEAAATHQREGRWRARLAQAGLPPMQPAALRQWQNRLQQAQLAAERLQLLGEEHRQAQGVSRATAASLAAAIVDTGLASATAEAPLRTLEAVAGEVDEESQRRERAIAAAAATTADRDEQRGRLQARRSQRSAEHETARARLGGVQQALLLTPTASTATCRARLTEFQILLAARQVVASAGRDRLHLQERLGAYTRETAVLAQTLGVPAPEPGGLRVFVDSIVDRLGRAVALRDDKAERQRHLDHASQALREAEDDQRREQALLQALCAAAGVQEANQLPEAEDRSTRRQEAQRRKSEIEAQLASASRRPVEAIEALLDQEDLAALDAEEADCAAAIGTLEAAENQARTAEEMARRALEAVDTGNGAAAAREGMESAAAAVRSSIGPWMRSRLAHALLQEATKRFRERAQGPMLEAASGYFRQMTDGEFAALVSDESGIKPTLLARRAGGQTLPVDAMSEGTLDQLYLALRLAALELRRSAGADLPVTLDDVLMTSDDHRAAQIVKALLSFSKESQVIVFTHHHHLIDVAERASGGAIGVIHF